MFNVIKRDGEVAAFQLSKITQAIEKASRHRKNSIHRI